MTEYTALLVTDPDRAAVCMLDIYWSPAGTLKGEALLTASLHMETTRVEAQIDRAKQRALRVIGTAGWEVAGQWTPAGPVPVHSWELRVRLLDWGTLHDDSTDEAIRPAYRAEWLRSELPRPGHRGRAFRALNGRMVYVIGGRQQ